MEQIKNKQDLWGFFLLQYMFIHMQLLAGVQLARCVGLRLSDNELGVTLCAEGSVIRSERAVAGVSVVLFHTRSSVATVRAVAAAVALTAWTHTWTRLCFALQVKGDAIYFQSSHAAQEAPLTTGSTWNVTKNKIK